MGIGAIKLRGGHDQKSDEPTAEVDHVDRTISPVS